MVRIIWATFKACALTSQSSKYHFHITVVPWSLLSVLLLGQCCFSMTRNPGIDLYKKYCMLLVFYFTTLINPEVVRITCIRYTVLYCLEELTHMGKCLELSVTLIPLGWASVPSNVLKWHSKVIHSTYSGMSQDFQP